MITIEQQKTKPERNLNSLDKLFELLHSHTEDFYYSDNDGIKSAYFEFAIDCQKNFRTLIDSNVEPRFVVPLVSDERYEIESLSVIFIRLSNNTGDIPDSLMGTLLRDANNKHYLIVRIKPIRIKNNRKNISKVLDSIVAPFGEVVDTLPVCDTTILRYNTTLNESVRNKILKGCEEVEIAEQPEKQYVWETLMPDMPIVQSAELSHTSPRDWIVESFCATGTVTILTGQLKSWLGLGIASAVSHGSEFLNHYATRKTDTLYISLKMSPRTIYEKLIRIGLTEADCFALCFDVNFKNRKSLELIIKEHPNTLIIIDGFNSEKIIQGALPWLQASVWKNNIALLIISDLPTETFTAYADISLKLERIGDIQAKLSFLSSVAEFVQREPVMLDFQHCGLSFPKKGKSELVESKEGCVL